MASLLPEVFVELREGRRCTYVHTRYLSISGSLTKETCAWAQGQGKARGARLHDGRGKVHSLVFGHDGRDKAIVKHYQRGGVFRCILRDLYWGIRRFIKELAVAERANAMGIPTAEVLALVTERRGLLFYRAHLVTREIPDSINLAEYLSNLSEQNGRKEVLAPRREVLVQVACLVKMMHQAGIYHADLNLKNILIQDVGDQRVKGYIIDLDRARYTPPLSHSQRLNNLIRLYRSLEKMGYVPNPVASKDIGAFVEVYCRDEPALRKRCLALLKRSPFSLRLHRFFWKIAARDFRSFTRRIP